MDINEAFDRADVTGLYHAPTYRVPVTKVQQPKKHAGPVLAIVVAIVALTALAVHKQKAVVAADCNPRFSVCL